MTNYRRSTMLTLPILPTLILTGFLLALGGAIHSITHTTGDLFPFPGVAGAVTASIGALVALAALCMLIGTWL
jgi:hypothetical protein